MFEFTLIELGAFNGVPCLWIESREPDFNRVLLWVDNFEELEALELRCLKPGLEVLYDFPC